MKNQLHIAKYSWSFYRMIKKTTLTEILILMAGIGRLNAQYRAKFDESSDGTSATTYRFTSFPLIGINLTGVMKYISSIFFFSLLIVQNNVYSQGFRWSTSGGIVGGTGSNSTGSFDIARDVNGNLFAFSNTTGNQQCQGDTVEHIGSTVLANGFIYKFNENGELIWLKAVGPEFYPYAIEVDGAGNSYVLGKTGTPSTLSTIDTTIDINGSYNIIKFNPDGELQWIYDTGMYLVGGNNRTSLLKVVQDRIYFQGDGTNVSCIDTAGVFITELNATYYDPNTVYSNIWFKNADVFSNGDILLCGEHQGRLGFDQDTLPLSENDALSERLFYLRCTPNLEVVWFKSYGSFQSSAAYPTGLAIDDIGDIYTSVLLEYSTPVVFGGDSLFNDDLVNGIGAITRINSNGEAIWMRAFESSVSPAMGGLTTSSEQSGAWFCGTHPGTITFGNTTLNGAQTSKGFIAHIDSSGQITRAFSYGTPASIQNFPQALTKNGAGEYYVCGFLSGSGSYELSCQNFPSNFGIAISAFNGEPDEVPTPSISINGTLLTATPEFLGDIQWFLNGNILNGETGQTLNATQNGNYTVKYTYTTGCVGSQTSAIQTVTLASVSTISGNGNIVICPNPSNGLLQLSGLSKNQKLINISIKNLQGITIYNSSKYMENQLLDITNAIDGIYFVEVVTEKEVFTMKVQKY